MREFEAEIVILHHATLVQKNYQAVMHSGSIRQSTRVLSITEKEFLRSGEKGLVRFRFMYHPEFLKQGSTVMFREGRSKGMGIVTRVFQGK